jgi:hypothetical protein
MDQTYEYYIVDPGTWKDVKRLTTVKSSTITRDLETETLGSATIDITESIGESYIRIYLVTTQNGVKEKHPLGTYLVQTPSSSFDGKVRNVTMDAYTPLLELKENQPELGYYVPKVLNDLEGNSIPSNIMEHVYILARNHGRAPVVEPKCSMLLDYDFVADPNDTWLSFLSDLAAKAKYSFSLDELGRILFTPKQDITSLQPVWTYTDDNSSILLPELDMDHDLYGIPNVVEVIYSNGRDSYYKRVVNDNPNSPTSTVNRGREIVHRVTDPDVIGDPTNHQLDLYAEQLLENLSTVEYSVTYTHGYCPVRLGDCVRLNYTRAGLTNIKARVVSQTIKCHAGCSVTEKAVFTTKLWR